MSLKITVEIDGPSEQQLTPLLAQWAANHPEGSGKGIQPNAHAPVISPRDFFHENSALLQQQIQQLTARNNRLHAEVINSQRLLAGVPPAPALPVCVPSNPLSQRPQDTQPPLLPERYQLSKGAQLRRQLKAPAQALAHCLGRLAAWGWQGKDWLLIFVLVCGGMYGVLTIAPVLSKWLWPPPEFVESDDSGPGATTVPPKTGSADKEEKPKEEKLKKEKTPAPALPPLPTSKAGSHPPPPPAFQQP
jgi:hypothetical protein